MTSIESMIKIETLDFDLNTLFNFQANFDQLKSVLSALATNQKKYIDRVGYIEKSLNIVYNDLNEVVVKSENVNFNSYINHK